MINFSKDSSFDYYSKITNIIVILNCFDDFVMEH